MPERRFDDSEDGKLRILRERTRFYNELVSTVWFVDSCFGNDSFESGTGFCVDPQGLILTCAHVVNGAREIKLVNLGDGLEYDNATVVRIYDSWDMAILRLRSDKEFDYVKFANDGDNVYCGEEIHSVGNPDELLGSFMTGRVAYPLDGYDPRNLGPSVAPIIALPEGCGAWDVPLLSYRTVGCISSTVTAYDKFDPNLPLIQISHYYAVMGASGGPVFDNRGYVVGMLFVLHDHYNLAIHFSALKYFLENSYLDDNLEKSNRGKKKIAPPETQAKKKKKAST